ncbi:MAG: pirin family protein [Acidobacteria bacterium]|nr:pirin family protein [Acidobacteriota bacterium]
MIRHVPASEHYRHENGWLTARWHFSFGDYHDPDNVSFGPLRVFNDDRVRPGRGFDRHPHREMEIITCVFSGRLEHEDSSGNRGILEPGDVQVMSAGSGIVHSERNPSESELLHFSQIWLTPWRRGGDPRYAQKSFPAETRAGKLLPVVSREAKTPGTLPIHQDAFIYLSDLGAGESATHVLRQARGAYVFLATGSAVVNGIAVGAGDAVRIREEAAVALEGGRDARFVVIDLV